jgi:cysteinyl-tRNA synthetase
MLKIYNSLSRAKEVFKPIEEGAVGMYVCGPTVYSHVHLGNCRTFISFDIIYRYLIYLGYKVRYVRNITDVGHLENDADGEGEDKIAKQARVHQLEPMEIVQNYTNGFRDVMKRFNTIPPSIEPTATGHIVEQIEMVQQIIKNGFAYRKNGSVYFDTRKFAQHYPDYGKLSGKVMDDLFQETRQLKRQTEKRHPADFAIWMKASPQHIMRWKSPWSVGFPGWHLECSAMSTKYLGEKFDIHGGGLDLQFPHHENEIAQNVGCCHTSPANYWLHTNMLTINGEKMSKSKGNSVLPDALFSGDNKILQRGYSPMTVRFFLLQTHYRSTLDFSDAALQAAEKAYRRMMEANKILQTFSTIQITDNQSDTEKEIITCIAQMHDAMNDDFNTAQVIAIMFDLVRTINKLKDGGAAALASISAATLAELKVVFDSYLFKIFGLMDESQSTDTNATTIDGLMKLVIDIRQDARARKDWGTSDKIRNTLTSVGIQIKDGKEGSDWVKI